MYIFEIIIKSLSKRRQRLLEQENEPSEVQEDYEGCKHFFLPIDSTADYLACNKCGLVIKNNQKPKNSSNFFLRK